MAIPKDKLAIIVANMKPKKDAGADAEGLPKGKTHGAEDDRLEAVADLLLSAIKDDDKESLVEALKDLCHCCREGAGDEVEEDDEEEEDEGY